MKRSLRGIAAASLILFAGAAMAAAPLTWRGDAVSYHSVAKGLAQTWHQQGHPRMVLQPFNTISGIEAVSKGRADVAGSARGPAPKHPAEKNLTFTPVAWDALVAVTNRHNPVSNITLKQLHDIYYGKIRNWNQLGGSNRPIHVFAVASPTDGIEFSFRRLMFGRGNQPVAAPRLYLNVDKLQKAVSLDPQGIGISTLSNARRTSGLKVLSIDGVRPSAATIRNGSYPLYSPLYLVTRDGATAQATAFVKFAQSKAAAKVLGKHDLVPYAQATSLAGHDIDRIKAIASKTGQKLYLNGHAVQTAPTRVAKAKPAPQRVVAAQPVSRTYTVVSGDTLYKIARKTSVSVSQLRALNNIKGDLIRVGQHLIIRR